MSRATNRFVIVVGIDFSDLSNQALDHALEVACLHENAEVHVLYVEPEVWVGDLFTAPLANATSVDEAVRQVEQRANERVSAMGSELNRRRLQRVIAHFRRGAPAEHIAQLAAELEADHVVVGSHGHRGIQRMLLGSVAARVSRLTRCPVSIIRPKDHATGGPVPEIEPPCPECVQRRQETGGEALWCARHSEHHIRPHRYSYRGDGFLAAESTAYESTPGM